MLTLVEVDKDVVVGVVHYFIEVTSHKHLDSVFRVVFLSILQCLGKVVWLNFTVLELVSKVGNVHTCDLVSISSVWVFNRAVRSRSNDPELRQCLLIGET